MIKPNLCLAILFSIFSLSAGIANAQQTLWQEVQPPADQGEQRGEKTFSIGLPLTNPYNLPSHLQVRLGRRFLIGGSLESNVKDSDDDKKTAASSLVPSAYSLDTRMHRATAYLEYYPVQASGFHVGFGVESRWGTYSEMFNDRGRQSRTAKGNFNGIFVGPSFGWTWLWDNGVTFGFDISKRARKKWEVTSTLLSPGSSEDLVEKVKEKHMPEAVPGMVMLGYSF